MTPTAEPSPESSADPSARPVDLGERVVLVLVTGPDRETLLDVARVVVGERIAACLNLLDIPVSVYRWGGEVVEESEAIGLIKTTERRLEQLKRRVRELHPYEEPEFLVLPIHSGAASYLAWVAESVAEE